MGAQCMHASSQQRFSIVFLHIGKLCGCCSLPHILKTTSRQHPQGPLPAKPRACSCHSRRCSRPEVLGAWGGNTTWAEWSLYERPYRDCRVGSMGQLVQSSTDWCCQVGFAAEKEIPWNGFEACMSKGGLALWSLLI